MRPHKRGMSEPRRNRYAALRCGGSVVAQRFDTFFDRDVSLPDQNRLDQADVTRLDGMKSRHHDRIQIEMTTAEATSRRR